ncbi:unnamed protein product [Enterobius vermicularis]|uniref:Crinkler (CRN) family protein n=1 Tax=Enterobius vermicularis TaxID=51028 RepID=A0A0N4V1X0_ENTVE|nr:unnamed protein product [Enterobius vermicularis]
MFLLKIYITEQIIFGVGGVHKGYVAEGIKRILTDDAVCSNSSVFFDLLTPFLVKWKCERSGSYDGAKNLRVHLTASRREKFASAEGELGLASSVDILVVNKLFPKLISTQSVQSAEIMH